MCFEPADLVVLRAVDVRVTNDCHRMAALEHGRGVRDGRQPEELAVHVGGLTVACDAALDATKRRLERAGLTLVGVLGIALQEVGDLRRAWHAAMRRIGTS